MSGETIVITRAKGDEKSLAEALQTRGYHVIHEPLSEIFLRHNERQALQHALLAEPDAVIVTSRHGVHALALLSELRDAYLLCVGEATARAAESLGFTRIGTAGGTAASLIETITQGYDAGSRFLYASAEHVRVDFEAALRKCNMEVERLVLYDAIAATQISDTLVEQLKRKQINAVTFFSQRAAQLFTVLLAKAQATEVASDLHAFCLSATVAEPLTGNAWKSIHVACEPTLASVVLDVDNIFHVQ